jgi:hypothetical protein
MACVFVRGKKMNKKAVFGLILLLSITSCVSSQAESDNSYARNLRAIEADNIGQLKEIDQYSVSNDSSAIDAINYYPAENRLRVLQTSGILHTYYPGKNLPDEEIDVSLPNSTSLTFDSSGNKILGAKQIEIRDDGLGEMEMLAGIGLWNAETGDLEQCIYSSCDESGDGFLNKIGATVDLQNQWVLTYSLRSLGITSLTGKQIDSTSYFGDSDTSAAIAGVEINSASTAYVIAYRNGKTEIDPLQGGISFFDIFLTITKTITDGEAGADIPRIDMRFSMDDHYLAQLEGDRVLVWSLPVIGKAKLIFDNSFSGAKVISFDQSGRLLFVGTDQNIFVIDLDQKQTLAKLDTTDLTTFFVSEDNKLVLWGDNQGVLHILGVKK